MSDVFQSGLLLKKRFTDFDDMAEDVASKWDQRYHRLSGESDFGFADQVNLSEAQLTHIGWAPGILIETGTPTDSVGLVLQIGGQGRLRLNGARLAEHSIGVLHSPRSYDLLNPEDTEYVVLAVHKDRLNRHFELLLGDGLNDVSTLKFADDAAQRRAVLNLQSGLELALTQGDWLGDRAGSDFLIDELLDSVFLEVRPDTEQAKPPRRQELAGRAGRFIRERIGQPLSLVEVCERFKVSERSLRQGFLDRYGMTPKAYIKRHRLHQLRLLLRAASPDNLTVTKAALQSGLPHLGRTAVEYRAAFGESPTATLRS